MILAATQRPASMSPDRQLADFVRAQGPRLRAFVRHQVNDLEDAEDIVQDALAELVTAARVMEPIEHAAAWLFRVARNRIVDRFRAGARRTAVSSLPGADTGTDPDRLLERWLPPAADGPEAAYARSILAEELIAALEELPVEQRDAFVEHEIEGRSFRELAASSGIPINTLLGRKHAAVRYLRRRLENIHAEFTD
jgi:RNA polymerase sigma factor (sigma-70 family)